MLQGLLSFRGPFRILNLSRFAFFLTFVVWFNYAPFSTTVQHDLGLTVGQARIISLCNLAFTIPARIIIGMLLDHFGHRITFSSLLVYAAFPTLAFAFAQNFNQLVLSRLAMGIVGAGFVVGIRLVAEWFPQKISASLKVSMEAGATLGLLLQKPRYRRSRAGTAFLSVGHTNWRLAIALTGIATAVFGVIFYCNVQDTPPGKVYQRPARNGAMEVTSAKSFWALSIANIPLFGALALIVWRLQKANFLTANVMYAIWISLTALYLIQAYKAWEVNREVVTGQKHYPPQERYQISQVFVLELAYAVSFGSELAVVSMLPEFFEHTFRSESSNGRAHGCYLSPDELGQPSSRRLNF